MQRIIFSIQLFIQNELSQVAYNLGLFKLCDLLVAILSKDY